MTSTTPTISAVTSPSSTTQSTQHCFRSDTNRTNYTNLHSSIFQALTSIRDSLSTARSRFNESDFVAYRSQNNNQDHPVIVSVNSFNEVANRFNSLPLPSTVRLCCDAGSVVDIQGNSIICGCNAGERPFYDSNNGGRLTCREGAYGCIGVGGDGSGRTSGHGYPANTLVCTCPSGFWSSVNNQCVSFNPVDLSPVNQSLTSINNAIYTNSAGINFTQSTIASGTVASEFTLPAGTNTMVISYAPSGGSTTTRTLTLSTTKRYNISNLLQDIASAMATNMGTTLSVSGSLVNGRVVFSSASSDLTANLRFGINTSPLAIALGFSGFPLASASTHTATSNYNISTFPVAQAV